MNKQGKIMLYCPVKLRDQWEEYSSNIDGNIVSNILENGSNGDLKIIKSGSIKIIAFLNEIKNKFDTQEKFKLFQETLERYIDMNELANLEVYLKL